ncbi:alpha/beta-hydrolase [Neoconidiobolus thromboides FSU 785]|nr:alpha/beta-hydrolase [Neoconidiobolus thromboides FSU 785]
MLLSYSSSVFTTFLYGLSLIAQYQAVGDGPRNGTVIIANGNVLSSNQNKLTLNANSSEVNPNEDEYFKNLMENLNYLKKNVRLEPQEMPDSRAFEMPSQLKVSDVQTSKYYARLAGAAYCKDANLKAWSCSHCKEIPVQHVGTYLDTLTQTKAYLAIDKIKKAITLGFRGSSTLRNFIQDAKFFKDPIVFDKKQYKVHRGFKQCSERVLPLYINDLKTLLNKYNDYKLVIVGHSLGGAIATLSTLILRQNLNLKDDRLAVFTFGEPRVGDKEFARYFNKQTFTFARVVNNNDIVPHLPPKIKLISDYHHHHNEIWVNGSKDVYCNDNYLEDPSCSASKWYTPSVLDHLEIWGITLGGLC